MAQSQYPGVRERTTVLLLNTIFAYAVFVLISGHLLPDGGIESVWFACAISYWFLKLLSAPWFIPPRDAIIAGVGSLLILVALELGAAKEFQLELEVIRSVAVVFDLILIGTAVTALFLNDGGKQSLIGNLAFRLTGIFGGGELLFSAPAVISAVAAYQNDFDKLAWLIIFWITVVVAQPIEKISSVVRIYRREKGQLTSHQTVGAISRIDYPNIVRVRLSSARSWIPNRLFTVAMPDDTQQYVVSLFSQTQGSEVVGTGLIVATAHESIALANGFVSSTHDEAMTAEFLGNLSGTPGAMLVGFVVEQSNIATITFEVSASSELNEGDVVFARLSGTRVFYQIVSAETSEENFDQNPRGTHLVRATQIGVHDEQLGFRKYPWLPAMNTPIFLSRGIEFPKTKTTERDIPLGRVPTAGIDVYANIDDLIEYHTAVLGVTGTGKTEVALEIVRGAVGCGAKVFCVDFTGDYRARLADLNPVFPTPDSRKARAIEGYLATIDAYGFKAGDEKTKLAAILRDVRKQTVSEIDEFLSKEGGGLAIFELAEISNSKAGLRLTEIFLSAIMTWAKDHRGQEKVLICLEEAHTIVPEAFGSGFDGETKWVVERIGQIALQGRKYGVGLLVITQRTALVSKTILSQCNTFLTHNLIDQTSLNFLESVYSSQHTRIIPNLGRFEFLAFGKAIHSERPILLRKDFDQSKLDASKAVHVRSRPVAKDEAVAKDGAIGVGEVNSEAVSPPPNDGA